MRIWDLKTGRCLRKSTFFISIVLLSNPLLLVEAHSPFVQCVAWAPAPLTGGSEDTDRILNVVATGGTDKVKNVAYVYRPHPLTTTVGDQNMATLISTSLSFSGV